MFTVVEPLEGGNCQLLVAFSMQWLMVASLPLALELLTVPLPEMVRATVVLFDFAEVALCSQQLRFTCAERMRTTDSIWSWVSALPPPLLPEPLPADGPDPLPLRSAAIDGSVFPVAAVAEGAAAILPPDPEPVDVPDFVPAPVRLAVPPESAGAGVLESTGGMSPAAMVAVALAVGAEVAAVALGAATTTVGAGLRRTPGARAPGR
jgi:hypothetical protein